MSVLNEFVYQIENERVISYGQLTNKPPVPTPATRLQYVVSDDS